MNPQDLNASRLKKYDSYLLKEHNLQTYQIAAICYLPMSLAVAAERV